MRKHRSLTVALVLGFVISIVFAGSLLFGENNSEEVPKKEQVTEKEEKPQVQITTTQEVENEEHTTSQTEVKEDNVACENLNVEQLQFLWPVEGNVIMDYNMDQTVYFATLDQYKYNPGLIIGGEIGADVMSVEKGRVTSVEKEVETGLTVVIEMANGYEAIYGQLMEVSLEPGQEVKKGTVLGKVAEPTIYYSVEGPNLYFALKKDGEYIDPLDELGT